MRKLLVPLILLLAAPIFAQSDIEWIMDDNEVRLRFDNPERPDPIKQQELREAGAWKYYRSSYPGWHAIMSEETELPHRAWGTPIALNGTSVTDKAVSFIQEELAPFGVNLNNLSEPTLITTPKHTIVRFEQMVDGIRVERSELTFRFFEDELIMWGADYYPNATLTMETPISETALLNAAADGLDLLAQEVSLEEMVLLPLPEQKGHNLAYAACVWVVGYEGTIPKKYKTYVDAVSGEILARHNTVMHISGDPAKKTEPEPRKVLRMGMPAVVSGVMKGTVYPQNVFDETISTELPYINFTLNGQAQDADDEGGFISTITGPVDASIPLSGDYCTIFTAGTTPEMNTTLADGYNVVELDNDANIRELSAYKSTSDIHDHMKTWLPNFTGLDFSLTTNIDVVGECNAFFDGVSINFYPDGGGCNPTSLIADVVYHEYGHGINGYYYNGQGASFNNGAMNEGYADFWSMSLTNSPLLAVGFYDDSENPLRRYDIDPKIYPEDLLGQVHNDGEIICGAWWDTHVLIGEDWDITRDLFIGAYAGLQATAFNGNEGNAYTDVLLDVLLADDDDGELNNGTPHGAEILEGFDMHGITLFAYADIEHDPIELAPAEESLEYIADAEIVFPFAQFFSSVEMFYRFSDFEEWQSITMAEENNAFVAELPGQEEATIVQYYFGIEDSFGEVSAVSPVAANKEVYPNLPFYTLGGVTPLLINDSDDFSQFGVFETGVSGDNATTGMWDEDIPVGSFTDDPVTPVAPDEDYTDSEEDGYCFVTGTNPGGNSGIGANDVDGGHTTLLSPVIDLTEYEDPIFAYWRWYTNAPASGANPGADWWQVEVSADGGSSWTYLENTLTQDISWRRKAFRISDYVDLTDEFQMRFIASDSLWPGTNLDGGSLIEAAVDDLVLYEAGPVISVEEEDTFGFTVFPNPASDQLRLDLVAPGGEIQLINARGSLVYSKGNVTNATEVIDVSRFAQGQYFLRYILEDKQRSELIQIMR